MIAESLHASTYKYSVVRKATGFLYLNYQGRATTRHQSMGNGASFMLLLYLPLVSYITFSLVKHGFIATWGLEAECKKS